MPYFDMSRNSRDVAILELAKKPRLTDPRLKRSASVSDHASPGTLRPNSTQVSNR